MKIKGEAYVTGGRDYNNATYIDEERTLWSGSSGVFCGQPLAVTRGYEWPFMFQIPWNCPSSFQAPIDKDIFSQSDAYIRYECKVITVVYLHSSKF